MVRLASEADVKAEEAKQLKAKAATMDQQMKLAAGTAMLVAAVQAVVLESLAITALIRWLRRNR